MKLYLPKNVKGFTLISKACDLKVLNLLLLRKRFCQSKARGFTLIELMVTITIIAILMSIEKEELRLDF